MKNITLTLAFILSLNTAVFAQNYDTGLNAYNSGDFTTALEVWKIVAERGDADAQFGLGYMYDNGEGVLQDYEEAAKWYRKAAEQGNAYAQYNMGVSYEQGQGVPQDSKEAFKWYLKAPNKEMPTRKIT